MLENLIAGSLREMNLSDMFQIHVHVQSCSIQNVTVIQIDF